MFKKLFGRKKKTEELEKEDIIETEETNIEEEKELESIEKSEVVKEIENIQETEVETENLNTEEDKEIEDIQEVETKEKKEKKSLFSRLKEGLKKTRDSIQEKVESTLRLHGKIDDELFEELEEILITADIGVNTSLEIIENVKDKVKKNRITEVMEIKNLLKEEMIELLDSDDNKLNIEKSPSLILVVGVNGAGKTTTIGKLGKKLKEQGKTVAIVAGDTFRAAAIEQLQQWGEKTDIEVISQSEGADPAAVIFDGIQFAKSKNIDVLICDTAGRLHNKKNLMNELNKISRIIERDYPKATKETLLVIDATTGQNAIQQAKVFKEAANITGIVLTKLDGTAKGGVVLSVQGEVNVPVKLVGVGEKPEDLQEFSSKDFIEAIFE